MVSLFSEISEIQMGNFCQFGCNTYSQIFSSLMAHHGAFNALHTKKDDSVCKHPVAHYITGKDASGWLCSHCVHHYLFHVVA